MSKKDTPNLKKNKPSLRATMKAFKEKKSGKNNELIFKTKFEARVYLYQYIASVSF